MLSRKLGAGGDPLKGAFLAATALITEEMFSALITMQWVEEIVGCVMVEAAQ